MQKHNRQAIVERLILLFCTLLLAYLIVRTYVLYRWDWNYIRGPLAPRHYYELGLINEPIPSKEYLPYTLIPTPIPLPLPPAATPDTSVAKPRESVESAKDSSAEVENSTGEMTSRQG